MIRRKFSKRANPSSKRKQEEFEASYFIRMHDQLANMTARSGQEKQVELLLIALRVAVISDRSEVEAYAHQNEQNSFREKLHSNIMAEGRMDLEPDIRRFLSMLMKKDMTQALNKWLGNKKVTGGLPKFLFKS